MAVLLQVKNATKSYGNQVLLDDAEFTLVDDVKVGFVGRNGAGKSTLLRVLLDEEELERGAGLGLAGARQGEGGQQRQR